MSAWNWKYATVQRRVRLGLEMQGPVAWPELQTWLRVKEAVGEACGDEQNDIGHRGRCQCAEVGLQTMLEDEATPAT